ncbi:MAG: signal peptide peptidase SppA [Bacteroidota bacterium]
MKQFFGAFFGSIIGMVVATLLAVLVIVAIVKSSVSSAFNDKSSTAIVKENSVLKIEFDGPVKERESENPFKALAKGSPFEGNSDMGLNTLLKKIDYAGKDNKIKGLYLNFKNPEIGFAAAQEIRAALLQFRNKGKFIYAYGEAYSQSSYYMASAANKVYLNPQGEMDWKGINMSLMFFKQTLNKLDVDMQVFRHGKFKSAIEPFLLDKMSEANRFQSETFLNSIWSNILIDISKSRKIEVAELNKMANELRIQFPENALGTLIDQTAYEDEVVSDLKKKLKLKESEKLNLVSLDKYEVKSDAKPSRNLSKIAVIYANGSISSGEGNEDEIGSSTLVKAIHEARTDEKVKAIVLRVNSPGGSALASDVIWREVLLAKKSKPVIVSMGNLAASGGYYISCGASHIFAEPNTITGSIGVFGIIPNIQKMLQNKFGITIDTVNTNLHSDVGSALRPVDRMEYQFIQNSVEKVYDTFTKRVAEGRGITQAMVDSIGQGRVWSGADAIRIKLVDELGGLNDAIAYAAKQIKATDYKLLELPKQKNPLDEFLGNKESDLETKMLKKNLGPAYIYFKQMKSVLMLKGVQARLPFEIVFN